MRNGAALRPAQEMPQPEHVGQPHHHQLEAVEPLVRLQHQLLDRLGAAVGRAVSSLKRLGHGTRSLERAVVDAEGADVHHAPDPSQPRCLGYIDGALDIDVEGPVALLGHPAGDDGRRVQHRIDVMGLDDSGEDRQVQHVPLKGYVVRGPELALQKLIPRLEVEKDQTFAPRRGIGPEGGADKPTACNQSRHAGQSSMDGGGWERECCPMRDEPEVRGSGKMGG